MNDEIKWQELSSRLHTQYEKKQSAFGKLFMTLFGLSTAFFAFVQLPHALLEKQRLSTDAHLATIATELESKQSEVAAVTGKFNDLQTKRVDKEKSMGEIESRLLEVEELAKAKSEKLRETENRLSEAERTQPQLKRQLQALENIRHSLEQFRFDPELVAQDLRAYFGTLRQERERGEFEPDERCPNQHELVSCHVRHWVIERLDNQLLAIQGTGTDTMVTDDIEEGLRKVKERLLAALDENPGFWRTFHEKLLFMENLEEELRPAILQISATVNDKMQMVDEQVREAISTLNVMQTEQRKLSEDITRIEKEKKEFESQRAKIVAERDAMAHELDALTAKLDKNRHRLDELTARHKELLGAQAKAAAALDRMEKRLSSFQTPFGPLPVGLGEGIHAFPLVVAVGLFTGALLLVDIVRLWRELEVLWQRIDPAGTVLTQERTKLFAPVWLDPTERSLAARAHFAAWALMIVLFAASVGLVFFVWSLRNSDMAAGPAGRGVLTLLYFVGATMVAGGTIALRREMTSSSVTSGEPAE